MFFSIPFFIFFLFFFFFLKKEALLRGKALQLLRIVKIFYFYLNLKNKKKEEKIALFCLTNPVIPSQENYF